MLVFIFIIATLATNCAVSYAASGCNACQLRDEFVVENGYKCFPLNNGHVACTCPDQRYTIDKPCRICERNNICGGPDNFCSEILGSTSSGQDGEIHHFSCFCADFSFYIGKACPASSTTTQTSTMTTTTTAATTSTTSTTVIMTMTTTSMTTTTDTMTITTTTMLVPGKK
ncbi:unnamed protein product [Adineta ricciae]|uniref:Uncharacterized protein n=1 Tax=Adineta ricciae TaxID=249248 RepID=A0A815E8Z9_ADIRI|nr:unnamed protein product [Adineta ricciae]CAF1311491.1 unnamed protein product [Adineta ricciae]